MNRRGFLTALTTGLIVVPKFGRFFREGAGELWRPEGLVGLSGVAYRTRRWTTVPAGAAVPMSYETVERVIQQIQERPQSIQWVSRAGVFL